MIQKNYDVIVVGAGPGGSAAAKHSALKGLKVLMVEKRQEIGAPKRCGEGLTFATLDIVGKLSPNCITQTINGARIYAPNKKFVDVNFGKDGGYVLERKYFDKWLAFNASRAGAYVQAKTEVKDVIRKDGFVKGVVAEFEGDTFEIGCKVLVAADGIESTIARKGGLDTTNKLINIDSGYQYEMSNLKLEDNKKIILYFGTEIAPRGYVWIFPKGNDVANVGIGTAMCPKSAREYLRAFIESRPDIFKDASIIEVNAGGIPVGGFMKNMVANGLVAVGDAAHQVNPIHGGGMKEASIAGRIAADVMDKCIKKGDVSQKALSEYNDIWWKERGKKLRNVEILREVTEKLSDDDFNMLAEALTGDVMVELSRGNSMSALAKVFMKKPKLMGLAKHILSAALFSSSKDEDLHLKE